MSDLLSNDQRYVWHPFTQHQTSGTPLPVVRAEGVFLYDEHGKAYIDANSSWWVNTHGHGHPKIAKALREQFEALDHVVFAGVTHPKAVELAERLTQKLPSNFERVFFSDNGSTANEVALKMAFQYWYNKGEKRHRVLALEGAYHGDTFGAMSVGERDYFNRPFEPFFFDVDYLAFPNGSNETQLLQEAEAWFETGTFASMIVEPLVQGAAGMRMYNAGFLDQLVALAKKFGVLVIFDEVMTGFGRTGKLFAMDHCQEKPDIVTFSKGLTAGVLPMGLTLTSDALFQAFLDDDMARGFLHGHSFTGNPLACAAACASLDLFEDASTWENIEAIASWNAVFMDELKVEKCVRDVAQMGTILRFEVESDGDATYFATNIRAKAYKHFLEHGVLIRPLGNVIFINPPYCIAEEEYVHLKSAILQFLQSI